MLAERTIGSADKNPRSDARAAVRFDKVRLSFGSELILDNLNLTVNDGEFVCFLGPSGCGKSTTLRLMGGLIEPSGGDIEILGRSAAEAWADLAFVFQSPRLLPWRTVLANVMLGMELRGVGGTKEERRQRATENLNLVGLGDDLRKYPAALSGGERQRVSLIRALALDPAIILMDEPLSALDVSTKQRLRTEILSIWAKTDKTVIFVTHDIDEALQLADRILLFSNKPTQIMSSISLEQPRPRDLRSPELERIRTDIQELFGIGAESTALEIEPESA